MPLRFRRTIRILPGLRLNASKSGLSVSAGRRGANVTVGHGKMRGTVGLPGTGLSYTTTTATTSKRRQGGILQVLLGIVGFVGILWLLAALLF